jgi:hypothetical protein
MVRTMRTTLYLIQGLLSGRRRRLAFGGPGVFVGRRVFVGFGGRARRFRVEVGFGVLLGLGVGKMPRVVGVKVSVGRGVLQPGWMSAWLDCWVIDPTGQWGWQRTTVGSTGPREDIIVG